MAEAAKRRSATQKSTGKPNNGAGSAKKKTAKRTTASRKVAKVMHEMHEGTLRSGRSGKQVTNPKQAIAIGLSEARRDGATVPAKPRSS